LDNEFVAETSVCFLPGEKLKVDGEKALVLNHEGSEIDSVDVIRDNDKLFIVTEEHMKMLVSMDSVSAAAL
jgi:hypothetical protein